MVVFDQLLEFFDSLREKLVEEHHNEYVVIYDNQLIKFFDSHEDAFFYADERYAEGTFLVAHCVTEEEDSATFRSRIALT